MYNSMPQLINLAKLYRLILEVATHYRDGWNQAGFISKAMGLMGVLMNGIAQL
jgi:hypothetical protein